MATGRILKSSVDKLAIPPAGKREYLWDDRLKGFGVMVTPGGVRSYIVQYRIGGRGAPTRRYTIGQHGNPWTADTARDRAIDLLEMVRKKIDPLDEERSRLTVAVEKKETDEKLAFSAYADFFVHRHAEKRGLRSVEDIRSVFRRDLKPFFGTKPITAIRRPDVQRCLDGVGDRSGSAANKAHKWLRKMLSFAVERGDLAASPMESMGPPHQEGQRKRVLRGSELVTVWCAADRLGEPWAAYVQALMLSGQRLREVSGMAFEELDLAAGTWIIPGARTKNKRDHLVPLSPQMIALIDALHPDTQQRRGFVFTTNGRTAIGGFSKLKRQLDDKVQDELVKAAEGSGDLPMPLEPWIFHDLRRSLATGCQALGFPIEHTEAVLNHVSGKRGGLAAIYQLHEYQDEKRAALNTWARHLNALLSGSDRAKVIPLLRA